MKTKKSFKTIAVILVTAMLLSIFAVMPVSATTPTYTADTTWAADSDGVYRIYDAADLLAFCQKSSANSNYSGKTVEIMADIDLNPGWDASTKTAAVNSWIQLSEFDGVLDGNGHTIRGICYINTSNNVGGLFKQMVGEGVGIHDLKVENSYLRSDYSNNAGCAGFFFANTKATNSEFKNVYVGKDVYLDSNTPVIGGFGARYWNGSGLKFTECVFAGTITSTNTYLTATVGGFMGNDKSQNPVTFTRCAFTGTINSVVSAGGILGRIGKDGHVMTECVSAGTINNQYPGGAGAFVCLDQRIFGGQSDTNDYNFYSDVRGLTLTDCYQIGNMQSFGYAVDEEGTINTEVYGKGSFKITVKYLSGAGSTYTISSADANQANFETVKTVINRAADVASLLEVSTFSDWAVGDDGMLIPPRRVTTPTYTADSAWAADEDGVYRIYDAADLLAFCQKSSAYSNYAGKTVEIMADIDLNPGWDASTKVEAVNKWTQLSNFNGVLDGNGHTIRGICYINTNNNVGGLFKMMEGDGVGIHDLKVENSYLRSDYTNNAGCAGFFFANTKATNSEFKNVYVGKDVYLDSNTPVVGGFGARYWSGSGLKFTDCVFAGTITSTNTYLTATVGGFMGNDKGHNSVTFTRCAFTGTINSVVSAGGIIGRVGKEGHVMTECVSAGTINNQYPGGAGAFVCLDRRIYGGQPNTDEYNLYKNIITLALTDCYQIGDIQPFGYAVDQSGTINTEVYGYGSFNITVKYLSGTGTTYTINSADENQANFETVKTVINRATDVTSLLGVSTFSEWVANVDGSLIPSGLASTMFQVRTAGYQIGKATDNKFSIRMVSVIDDSAAYSSVGYDYIIVRQIDNKVATGELRSTEVYESIYAAGDSITAESLYGNYIFAVAITNIPTSGTYTITIKPVAVSVLGESIYGSDIVLTVIDGVVQNGDVA